MSQFLDSADFRLCYSEVRPPSTINHLVDVLFEFFVEGDLATPITHEVFPDGCVSLLYRRNRRMGVYQLLMKGLSLEPFYTHVFADDVYWGVRLTPSSAAEILRCNPCEVSTQPVSEGYWQHLTSGLVEKLDQCNEFLAAQDVFAEMLGNLNIKPEQIDSRIAHAIKLITDTNGEAMVSEIAHIVGLSRRQLERSFRKAGGLTPKQFSRVRRFRAAAENMINSTSSWAKCAAEFGFADQAHLSREISSLTKRSPKSFERLISKFEHEGLVQ